MPWVPSSTPLRERDAELTAIASASAGTAGIGLALTTLLAGLAFGVVPGGDPGGVSGRLAATELAVITFIPLAAFELVVGLPVATQALQRIRQAATRVFEVIDVEHPSRARATGTLPGSPFGLQVRSVSAGYPGAAGPALRGVDLSLPPRRRVAIVGASGAGKSTLAAVLVRFFAYQAGTVSLDEVPLDRLAGDDLRQVVGMISQDEYLFDTTLAENLRIGRREASDSELRHVVERVGLADWLEGLPVGLATEVGRHGARLSGGQRQRVAVARALLADFPVLVLDEPAEHLDLVAADSLTADLLAVTDDRSLVLITHRLFGLESVDEILVMEAGRVVERGTHDQLLGRGPRYQNLWWEEMRQASSSHAQHQPATEPMVGTSPGALNDWSPTQ